MREHTSRIVLQTTQTRDKNRNMAITREHGVIPETTGRSEHHPTVTHVSTHNNGADFLALERKYYSMVDLQYDYGARIRTVPRHELIDAPIRRHTSIRSSSKDSVVEDQTAALLFSSVASPSATLPSPAASHNPSALIPRLPASQTGTL